MTGSRRRLTLVVCLGLVVCAARGPFVGAKPTSDGEGVSDSEDSLVQEKIQAIKTDILARLGRSRPRNASNFTVSLEEKRRAIQEYRKYIAERRDTGMERREEREEEEEDRQTVSSRTYHALEYAGVASSSSSEPDVPPSYRLHFRADFAGDSDDSSRKIKVDSARLRVFKAQTRPERLRDKYSVDKHIRVNVHQILATNGTRGYMRKFLDSRLVSVLEGGWETFDVAAAVQEWKNDKSSNLGLEVSADTQDIREVIDFDVSPPRADESANVSESTSPSLHAYAQEEYNLQKRVKRRGKRRRRGECTEGDGETRCCRYPITISFREIGMDDWILAPASYHGYYCAGSCPYRYRMANTFSGIKALLHLQDPDKVPPPCCVATKLSPFTILHYDAEGRYAFSDYPDLVVDQCKCG